MCIGRIRVILTTIIAHLTCISTVRKADRFVHTSVTHGCTHTATDTRTSRSYCLLADHTPISAFDAARACIQQGYFLVSVDSQQERDFLAGQSWWQDAGVSAYWVRLMFRNKWLKWLDCREPSWTNWETNTGSGDGIASGAILCAYASLDASHSWRSTDCSSDLPNAVLCEKEEDNCLVHLDDWSHGRQYCYLTLPAAFTAARDLCEDLGYRLAQFEMAGEMPIVFDLFALQQFTCFSYPYYWLGLVNPDANGWRWQDGTVLGWSNWQTSPPGVSTGCAAASSSNDRWEPRACAEEHVILCEKNSVSDGEVPSTASFETTTDETTVSETTSPSIENVTNGSTIISPVMTSESTVTDVSTYTSVTREPVVPATTTPTQRVARFPGVRVFIEDNNKTIEVACPEVDEREGRMISSQRRAVGSMVRLFCSDGYTFNNGGQDSSISSSRGGTASISRANTEVNMTCAPGGQWSPPPQNCTAMACPILPTWHALLPNTTKRHYLTVVNVSCQRDYCFPDGSLYRLTTCGARGRWQPPVPPCQPIGGSIADLPTEAPQAAVFGGLAAGIIGLLLATFLFLDVKLFRCPPPPAPVPPKPKPTRKTLAVFRRHGNRVGHADIIFVREASPPIEKTINYSEEASTDARPQEVPDGDKELGNEETQIAGTDKESQRIAMPHVPLHRDNTLHSSMTMLL